MTEGRKLCDYALIKKGCNYPYKPRFYKLNEVCDNLALELKSRGLSGLWACGDWDSPDTKEKKEKQCSPIWWWNLPPTLRGYDKALINPNCKSPKVPVYNTGSWKNSDPMWCCNDRFDIDNTGRMGGSTYYKCKDNQSYQADRCYPQP